MSSTAVVFSRIYFEHSPGMDHPESPQRLGAIVNELARMENSGSNGWHFVRPEKARVEDVELIHSREYVKLVEAVCAYGGGSLDLQDTVVSPESYRVALYAVGGALKAVNFVMQRKFKNAFALVRPPGHHASMFRACGFCIFNNVAIAAKYLLEKHGLRRVLMLDLDAHHGNGTQEAFYDTNNVLFVSLHEDPRSFPGTGFIEETGEGKGLGYNVNIPLPFGTSDYVYLKAFREIVMPIVRQYKPEFALVSAGFDGHYSDPVGNLSLSASCYKRIYDELLQLVSELCEGRLACVLEGGYNPDSVGKLAASAIAAMSGLPCKLGENKQLTDKGVEKRGLKIVEQATKVQRSFWNLT